METEVHHAFISAPVGFGKGYLCVVMPCIDYWKSKLCKVGKELDCWNMAFVVYKASENKSILWNV